MYEGQFLHYQCDMCLKREYVKTFPAGWIWVKSPAGDYDLNCVCNDCKSKVPSDKIPNFNKGLYSIKAAQE